MSNTITSSLKLWLDAGRHWWFGTNQSMSLPQCILQHPVWLQTILLKHSFDQDEPVTLHQDLALSQLFRFSSPP